MNLFDYFEIKAFFKEEKPIVIFKLKEKFKENKIGLFKLSGQAVSGAQIEYYIHYLGNSLGPEVYQERRKYFGLQQSCKFALENKLFSTDQKKIIDLYFIALKEKILLNHGKAISKAEYREKLKESSKKSKAARTAKAKHRWQNKEWKENQLNIMFSKEALIKRSESFASWCDNNKDKLHLKALKNIKSNPWVLDNLSCSGKKNYSCNGIKMNSIEVLIADLFKELQLEWIYEPKISNTKETFIPDFFLTKENLIVECYGDYWHCHTDKFKNENDILPNRKTVKQIREHDKKRENFYLGKGYKFIAFWECNIKNDITSIKQTILTLIKK